MTEKEKKSLELIAKNLSVCSKRTVEDVLMHLPESKKAVQIAFDRATPNQFQYGLQQLPERRKCNADTPYFQRPHAV